MDPLSLIYSCQRDVLVRRRKNMKNMLIDQNLLVRKRNGLVRMTNFALTWTCQYNQRLTVHRVPYFSVFGKN